jgi:hypothetical protein
VQGDRDALAALSVTELAAQCWKSAAERYIARLLRPLWLRHGAVATGAAWRVALAGPGAGASFAVRGAALRLHSVRDAEALSRPLAALLSLLDDSRGGDPLGVQVRACIILVSFFSTQSFVSGTHSFVSTQSFFL